jgi:hypothetical protein
VPTVADNLQKALDAADERLTPPRQIDKSVNRASSAGWLYDCQRHLVLMRLAPEKEIVGKDQERRFSEGRKQEKLMRADFVNAEVKMMEFKEPGDTKSKLPEKARTITEPKIKFEPDDIFILEKAPIVPVDYKSCSSAIFREIKRYEVGSDLKSSRLTWIRHYPVQMNIYCAGWSASFGLMPFKDKESGEKKIIECPYNSGDFAYIVDGFKEINRLVEKEELPPVVDSDACHSCGFQDYCYPEEKPKTQAATVKDPDLAQKILTLLERRRELMEAGVKEAAKELETTMDEIKEEIRALGEVVEIGDYRVTCQKSSKTEYEIPDDVKKQYKKLVPSYKPIKIVYFGGPL